MFDKMSTLRRTLIAMALLVLSCEGLPKRLFLMTRPLVIDSDQAKVKIFDAQHFHGLYKVLSYQECTACIRKPIWKKDSLIQLSKWITHTDGQSKATSETAVEFRRVIQFRSENQPYPHYFVEAKMGRYYTLLDLVWREDGFDLFAVDFDPNALVEARMDFRYLSNHSVVPGTLADVILIDTSLVFSNELLHLAKTNIKKGPRLSLQYESLAQKNFYMEWIREHDPMNFLVLYTIGSKNCAEYFESQKDT